MISKLRGRSWQEITFRAKQEFANFSMFLWAPSPGQVEIGPLPLLPDGKTVAAELKGTPYAAEVDSLAREIMAHQFPLLGLTVSTGPEINWRMDYPNGKASELKYMRRVPYLDFQAVGDHKNVWELNRHQHLVLLAQAYLLTRNRDYLTEIVTQLTGWMAANPFMRGINWTSALEVAFRTLSWIWIWHLLSNEFDAEFRKKLLTGLYQHGCYLEHNLSVYFSPNTHLLGEALALNALGVLFPALPRAAKWKTLGGDLMQTEIRNQVRDDGSHFEQSTYYHVYALDMVAFYLLLNPEIPKRILAKMAEYLEALLGRVREIPCFGDDDGGRFFHPYGIKNEFGRASLAVASLMVQQDFYFRDVDVHPMASWWLGSFRSDSTAPPFQSTKNFPDAGMVVDTHGHIQVHLKYGPMGPGGAGHSHADLLSFTLRDGDEPILIDAGTFTYVGDAQWRDWFRGTAAHNTVVIDGLNQATPTGPFRWIDKPTSVLESSNPVTVVCRYHGFTHRRRLIWPDASILIVVDELDGPPGEHEVAQLWHSPTAMSMVSPACFRIGSQGKFWANPETSREYGEGGQLGWMSPEFGVKQAAAALRVFKSGPFPHRLVAVIDFEGRYSEWQPAWSRA